MERLLFAINEERVEKRIAASAKEFATVVGVVQYREAVINALATNSATLLLIRESIPGSQDFVELVRDIRFECPHVRIIAILNQREERTDPTLQALVSVGVYDIINSNSVAITDIVNHIAHPFTFRDVAEYYGGVPKSLLLNEDVEDDESEKRGFFGGLFGGKPKGKKPSGPAVIVSDTRDVQQGGVSDAMRAAIAENADRRSMQNVNTIAEEMTKMRTAELEKQVESLNEQLKAAETARETAKEQSYRAISDADAARRELLAANQEIDHLKADAVKRENDYQREIEELRANDTSATIAEQVREWREREDAYGKEIESLRDTIASLEEQQTAARKQAIIAATDVTSGAEPHIIMPEDTSEYAPTRGYRTICMVGAKHGVGNTTAALNVATALSQKGHKTVLIEFNDRFPLLNQYFEFLSVKNGLDSALTGIEQGDMLAIDAAIIKPHGINTDKPQLQKAYNRMPSSMHFLLFENERLLVDKKEESARANAETVRKLVNYLHEDLDYENIVLDVQPDDRMGRAVLLGCGDMFDRVVMTTTQDPHSVSSLGVLVNMLASVNGGELVKKLVIAMTGYDARNSLSLEKVASWLHLGKKRFVALSDDRTGYLNAATAMSPYLLRDGRYVGELRVLAESCK